MSVQPRMMSKSGKREFACYPVAVLVIVLNGKSQVLLLSHPDRSRRWEVVGGGLEEEETVLDAVMRECREELGIDVKIRPIGTLHAQTFAYDEAVPKMISIVYVASYEGGEVIPGDDMAGSVYKWVEVSDIIPGKFDVTVPRGQTWLFQRALEMYRLWKTDSIDLQIDLLPSSDSK